jgi:hypothetical protein
MHTTELWNLGWPSGIVDCISFELSFVIKWESTIWLFAFCRNDIKSCIHHAQYRLIGPERKNWTARQPIRLLYFRRYLTTEMIVYKVITMNFGVVSFACRLISFL